MKIGQPIQSETIEKPWRKFETAIQEVSKLKQNEMLPITFDNEKEARSAAVSLSRRKEPKLRVIRRREIVYISKRN